MASKELARIDTDAYAITQAGNDIADILTENVGEEGGLTPFDLDRIKVPSGGGAAWEVPTLEGSDVVKELSGVIVYWRSPRAYWATGIDEAGGGAPPDCSSDDGKRGVGQYGPDSSANPTGECATCPMNAWGSDPAGRGKACKETRILFLATPEDLLPKVVVAPPTSIKPIRKFFLQLANKRTPYYGVETTLTLEKVRNAAGIEYAEIRPRVSGYLDADTIEQIRDYGAKIRATMEAISLQATDVTDFDDATEEV